MDTVADEVVLEVCVAEEVVVVELDDEVEVVDDVVVSGRVAST